MRGHVALAMEQGAVGFSTGLIYEPGRYSDTGELAGLASESGSRERQAATSPDRMQEVLNSRLLDDLTSELSRQEANSFTGEDPSQHGNADRDRSINRTQLISEPPQVRLVLL